MLPPDVRPPEPPHRARLLRRLAIGVALAFVAGIGLTVFGGGSGSTTTTARTAKATPTATKTARPPATPKPTASVKPTPTATPSPTRQSAWDGRSEDFGYLVSVQATTPAGVLVRFDRADFRNGRVRNQSGRLRTLLLAPEVQVKGGRELAGSDTLTKADLEDLVKLLAESDSPLLTVLGYDEYGRVIRVEERS